MPTYADKQFFCFEPQFSESGERVYGNINSGLWWEIMSLIYPDERIVGLFSTRMDRSLGFIKKAILFTVSQKFNLSIDIMMTL